MNISSISKKALNLYNKESYNLSIKEWSKILKLNIDKYDRSSVLYNIGLCYYSLNKFDESLNYFIKANNLQKSSAYEWQIALSYFNLGDFNKGKDFYKSRYKTQNNTSVTFPNFPIEQFSKKEEWRGKRVLVMNEQGFGDEILFSTKFKEFSNSVESAVIKVSKELKSLFEHLYSELTNITFKSFDTISFEEVMEFDGFLASGDLFFELYENDNLSLNIWKENTSNKVGVCWKANSNSPNQVKRSVEHSEIIDGIDNWTSLQYNEFGFQPKDFLETFNVIKELKEVITIDTSVAHLCGLIGIPTKLIINKHYDWRWRFNTNNISNFYNNISITFK